MPIDAAAVYDTALLFLAIYHIIEWLKTTIVLTVVFVGINLVWLYLILTLNTFFGFFAIIYTVLARFSEEGMECAGAQQFRAQWLVIEVIVFGILLILWPGPMLPLVCCSKRSHQDMLESEDEGDDDEE